MAEYYGVTRTPEYLMHYGVKGMRWGVRKAIERGNDKKLWRQYSKAQKKLNKLSRKADPSVQKRNEIKYEQAAKGYRKIGRFGLGMAVPGTAGLLLSRALRPKIWKKAQANRDAAYKEYEDRMKEFNGTNWSVYNYATPRDMQQDMIDHHRAIEKRLEQDRALIEKDKQKSLSINDKVDRISGYIAPTGVGMAIAGYGGYGINKLKAHKARKRQTAEGNKAAKAERDAWQKEMRAAFKGTKYANSLNESDYAREYYKRNKARIDKKQKRLDAYDRKTNNRRFRQRYD